MTVAIEQPLADFQAEATSGQQVTLSALKGQQVVLYFYPKDSTPGCTTQAIGFRDHHAAFAAANVTIVGVSRDSLKSHENFRQKFDFPFQLISDPEERLCRQFDVIREKNMYGRKVLGVERSTFLIDADGKLAREWRGVKVKGHVEEVLAAVKAL